MANSPELKRRLGERRARTEAGAKAAEAQHDWSPHKWIRDSKNPHRPPSASKEVISVVGGPFTNVRRGRSVISSTVDSKSEVGRVSQPTSRASSNPGDRLPVPAFAQPSGDLLE